MHHFNSAEDLSQTLLRYVEVYKRQPTNGAEKQTALSNA